MVDFRRWIIALAVLTLFAGLAGAQVSGNGNTGPLTCTASVAVPPQLRAEAYTEQIGDILITCAGGALPPGGVGSVIPTANITVSLATNVTSRIIGSGGLSEALLLIDEPGAPIAGPVPGSGPNAPQTTCTTGAGAGPGGCVELVGLSPAGIPIAVPQTAGTNVFPGSGVANIFIGTVTANQVTFFGIPILAPVTSGSSRVFRITNVRANIAGTGFAGLGGITPLNAFISISGATSLPVNNPVQIAGFIQKGLTVSNGSTTFNQCNSQNISSVTTLKFTENFGTAFKTRVAPTSATLGSGQFGPFPGNAQNVPGLIYNSESGFISNFTITNSPVGGISTGVTQIGLADYGTRLKAVFNNVPAGVSLFVSVTNLASSTSSPTIAQPVGNSPSSFAVLVNGEATPDGNGSVPALPPTGTANGGATAIYQLLPVGGTATAVWEVVNTNPAAIETFNFGVWASYTFSSANGTPGLGDATVNQSFAPTPPNAGFSATQGGTALTGPIPRFADTSSANKVLSIIQCQTLLLFPFVTHQSGFDTGIAISNTTSDPVGTVPQTGTCKLTYYDGTGKQPPTGINGTDLTKEAPVLPGTSAVNQISTLAPGFQGYMFAQCNFQAAHGFAFISDLGARNLAMGYLALVVTNGTPLFRPGAPSGESLAH